MLCVEDEHHGWIISSSPDLQLPIQKLSEQQRRVHRCLLQRSAAIAHAAVRAKNSRHLHDEARIVKLTTLKVRVSFALKETPMRSRRASTKKEYPLSMRLPDADPLSTVRQECGVACGRISSEKPPCERPKTFLWKARSFG